MIGGKEEEALIELIWLWWNWVVVVEQDPDLVGSEWGGTLSTLFAAESSEFIKMDEGDASFSTVFAVVDKTAACGISSNGLSVLKGTLVKEQVSCSDSQTM